MIKHKSSTAAFTLIELLVVITIIGILAGIALPVFNSVQVKGAQTKALAQAKQIGLALKLCASDNDGVYPKNGVPATVTTAPATSNAAFFPLFPTYTQSEKIFGNKLSAWQTGSGPDDVIDGASATTQAQTLKAGENVYGYMMGLSDASSPSAPIVFDGTTSGDTTGTYSTTQTVKGGVWSGTKAVVVRLDNSAAVETVSATTHQVMITVSAGGTPVSLLDPANNTNITGCTFLNPL